MIKVFTLVFTSLFFFCQAFGQVQTVTDVAGVDFANPVNVDLLVTPTSGGATTNFDILEARSTGLSEGAAHRVFVPFRTDDDVVVSNLKNDQFSYYANRTLLPRIDSSQPVEFSVVLRFSLNIDITLILDHLHVAIKGDNGAGGFRVLKFLGVIPGDTSFSQQSISIRDLCTTTGELDCSSLDKDVAPSAAAKSVGLHFFLSDIELNENDPYTPAADNGVFYQINLSTKVSDDRVINLTELQKGDSQLIADYNGFSMNDIRGLYATAENKGPGLCSGVVDASIKTETLLSLNKDFDDLIDLETVLFLGQKKVEGLLNDNCYEIRLFQCNLYGFCSYASQSYQNTPEAIEALLKKQACFFFTAGFGREHYIVNYFQKWRNQVLRKFWLGRVFISWYYKTAPQYTPYILKTPWLQKTIQGVAYLLYGLIKLWWLAVLLVVVAAVQIFARKKGFSRNH